MGLTTKDYLADPGGVFASDAHRRTLGHLPLPGEDPISVEALLDRVAPDEHSDFADTEELTDVLEDLEADGNATSLKDGWKQTKKGLDALSGPNATETD